MLFKTRKSSQRRFGAQAAAPFFPDVSASGENVDMSKRLSVKIMADTFTLNAVLII